MIVKSFYSSYYKSVKVNRAKLIKKGNLLLQPWAGQWGRDCFLMNLHQLKCDRCDLVGLSVPKESLVTCEKCGFKVLCEPCFEYAHAGGYFQTHEKCKVGVYGVKSMEIEEEQDGMSDGTVEGERNREVGHTQLIDSTSAGTGVHDVRSRDAAAVEGGGPGGGTATKLREPIYVGDEEVCRGTSGSRGNMGYYCTVVDDDTRTYRGGGDDSDSYSASVSSGDGDDYCGDVNGGSSGGVVNGGRRPRFRRTLVWPGDHRYVGGSVEGQGDGVSDGDGDDDGGDGDGGYRDGDYRYVGGSVEGHGDGVSDGDGDGDGGSSGVANGARGPRFRTTLVASGVANGGRGPRFRTTRTTLVWPGDHGHVPACDLDQP